MKNLKKFFKIILRNCIFLIFFVLITGITLKLINLYTPLLTRKIIDNISNYKNINALKKSLIYIIYLLSGFLSISFINSILNINYNIKIEKNIREFYLNEILLKKITFFEKFSKGEIIYRLEKDFLSIAGFINQIILSIPLNLVMFSSLFFMINWDKTLTVFVIILVFIQSIVVIIFKNPLSKLSKKFKEHAEKLDNYYINLLNRIFLLKTNNAYYFEKNKHNSNLKNLFKIYKTKGIVSEFSSILIHFIFNLWTFAIIWYGGKQVISGKMTVGQIFGFMMYANMLSSPINYFINFFFQIPVIKVSLKRILEVINYDKENYSEDFKRLLYRETLKNKKSDIILNKEIDVKIIDIKIIYKDKNHNKSFKFIRTKNNYSKREFIEQNENKNYGIIINNMYFSYNQNNYVLQNINFKFPSKGISIISGESGCGKTTLCKILSGFYINYEGSIKIFNKELKDWEVDKLREKVLYIPQHIFLIDGDIFENIFYGIMDKSNYFENNYFEDMKYKHFKHNYLNNSFIEKNEKIKSIFKTIIKNSNKQFKIEMLNKLYNFLSEIDKNNPKLSQGQSQRIAFLRGIIKNPDILILDEPTSALDKKNEKILLDFLNDIKKSKSIIIVTHKKELINLSDNILTL